MYCTFPSLCVPTPSCDDDTDWTSWCATGIIYTADDLDEEQTTTGADIAATSAQFEPCWISSATVAIFWLGLVGAMVVAYHILLESKNVEGGAMEAIDTESSSFRMAGVFVYINLTVSIVALSTSSVLFGQRLFNSVYLWKLPALSLGLFFVHWMKISYTLLFNQSNIVRLAGWSLSVVLPLASLVAVFGRFYLALVPVSLNFDFPERFFHPLTFVSEGRFGRRSCSVFCRVETFGFQMGKGRTETHHVVCAGGTCWSGGHWCCRFLLHIYRRSRPDQGSDCHIGLQVIQLFVCHNFPMPHEFS